MSYCRTLPQKSKNRRDVVTGMIERGKPSISYYVDAVGGSDSNNGLTTDLAWQSRILLNSAPIRTIDKVSYKYGAIWTTTPPYFDFSGLLNGSMPIGWDVSNLIISNGAAINNTPTLTADKATDGGMENWNSPTDLTSWTEAISGSSTVNKDTDKDTGTYDCRLDIDSSNSNASVSQVMVNTQYQWLIHQWRMKVNTATVSPMVLRENGAGIYYPANVTTSYVTYAKIARAAAANTTILMGRDTATSKSIFIDNYHCYGLNIFSCMAFAANPTPAADCRVTAQVTIQQLGMFGGALAKWDSKSSPQNGLMAYVEGGYPGYVKLDQCVSGVWSNLISVQVSSAETDKYIDGEFVEISVTGTTATLRYRGQVVGTPQAINAGLASNVYWGIVSAGTSVSDCAKVLASAIDYRTAMITPEVLLTNTTFDHKFDRKLYGGTTKGDMDGMTSGVSAGVDYTRIHRVISPTRGDLYSCYFRVETGDAQGMGGERAEIYEAKGPNGTYVDEKLASGTQYYAFSIYLPTTWTPPDEQDPSAHVIWGEFLQLHPPDVLGDVTPSIYIQALDRILLTYSGGNLDGVNVHATSVELSDGSIHLGSWMDFVMKVLYKNDLTGTIQLWRRNAGNASFTSVLSLTGVPTLWKNTGNPDGAHLWRRGYYRAAQTAAHTNILYQGPFVRGTSYADVINAAFSTVLAG